MNEETLHALQESIVRWKNKRDHEYPAHVKLGWGHCPLCVLYHPNTKRFLIEPCNGCPVKDRTGLGWCEGTPYYAVQELKENYSEERDREQWRILCQQEIDFLTSLLPPETTEIPGTTPA